MRLATYEPGDISKAGGAKPSLRKECIMRDVSVLVYQGGDHTQLLRAYLSRRVAQQRAARLNLLAEARRDTFYGIGRYYVSTLPLLGGK